MAKDLHPNQVRAGRAILGIGMDALADAAGISAQTILRIENGATIPNRGTVSRIADAFAALGVEFLDETATAGCGVRMREPTGGIVLVRRDVIRGGVEIGAVVRISGRAATARIEVAALDAGGDADAALMEFDLQRPAILRAVARKIIDEDFSPDGHVRVTREDLVEA